MRCIVRSLQVVFAICCLDSIFAYSPLPLEAVIARVNRVPHSVSLSPGYGAQMARIVGGRKTPIEEVPYQVSLRYFNNHICGGSIISHSWVLTAAHCLDWYPNNDEISVRTGSNHQSTGGSLHAVFYYHLHEHYDTTKYQWDVATIRVRTAMVNGPAISAIPLSSLSGWTDGERVTIAGWGYLAPVGTVIDNLQMVRLDVIPRELCNQSWTGIITDDMICAGGPGLDACEGDSGGPAVQGGMQHGIVSWGPVKCGNGLPGVFTNIGHPSVRNFIRRTTMV
uniref:Peptidase S1 domain-containing protein n=1 Tax=Anopheles minimus TaxID=112268 RepID=A0A182VVY4_9DIPT